MLITSAYLEVARFLVRLHAAPEYTPITRPPGIGARDFLSIPHAIMKLPKCSVANLSSTPHQYPRVTLISAVQPLSLGKIRSRVGPRLRRRISARDPQRNSTVQESFSPRVRN